MQIAEKLVEENAGQFQDLIKWILTQKAEYLSKFTTANIQYKNDEEKKDGDCLEDKGSGKEGKSDERGVPYREGPIKELLKKQRSKLSRDDLLARLD